MSALSNENFSAALPAGTHLRNGAFTIGEVLGQGGFGITYRARDETLHRDAAVKEFFLHGAGRDGMRVLASSAIEFQNAREQFVREARALAQFNHPNIVDVYSVFEENDAAYMVMEFVRGSTLTQLLQTRGAMSESEALKIIEQIGAALSEVHRSGSLHLDVKPDNAIIEDVSTRAVLLDFGLTKKIEAANVYGTMRLDSWSRFGTPGFAAIEQYAQDGRVGIWTDVYGLAATLYFLLAGGAPPDAASRATGTPVPDIRAINADVSTPVARALEIALRLPPEERPQTVEDFMRALHEVSAPLQTLPSADASTHPPDFNDPFALPGPKRPGPQRPGPTRRPRIYNPRNPASDNPFENTPVGFVPISFGCTSVGCSIGCFLFIAIFLMVIAAMMNSVTAYLPF